MRSRKQDPGSPARALRESVLDLRRAQALSRTGSWRLDVRHDRIVWSDEVYRIFGIPKGTPVSYERFLAAVHPDDRERIDQSWKAALAGRPYDVEHRIVVGDQVKWVSQRAELELDGDGRPIRAFGAVQDISERKRAEEAVRRHSEALSFLSGTATRLLRPAGRAELFEFVAERIHATAGDAIISVSEFEPKRRRIVVRQFRCTAEERDLVARLLGRDPEGLAFDFPEPVRAGMVPGELQRLPGGIREATFGQLPVPVCELLERELRLGDVFAMACAVDEDILGTVAVFTRQQAPLASRELIESVVNQAALALRRWRTEETLRESEERFRTLADNIAQLAWMADRDGEPFWFNARWTEYTGARLDEMTDRGWSEACHPDELERVLERLERCFESGEPCEDTFQIRGRDGGYRWFLAQTIPVRDQKGEVVRWFGTCTDVTLQRQAEEALREADRRKNDFLAMLSHELRNPLAPIRNSIYVLERTDPGGEQARRAQSVIDRQTQHLTRLVDDLLDVTRIARGKVSLRRQPLDLNEVVRRTAEDHRGDFLSNGVDLSVAICDERLELNGDPTRLAQVVGNLLQNAARFTAAGGRAAVSLARRGALAEIRVRDDGAGIAPEDLPRLFEPFVQVDTTLARSRGGLGLGLALVKGFAEMHGGTVRAESAGLGKGALFVVELPIESAPARQAPSPSAAAPARPDRRPQRVLVIEDNLDAASSLKEALELNGHAVEVAYTGHEGLEKAREFRPSVVLCDLGLPGMDGYAVARAMRADAALGTAFLLALSGYALQDDQDRSREAGFDGHVAKPPDLGELQRLIAGR